MEWGAGPHVDAGGYRANSEIEVSGLLTFADQLARLPPPCVPVIARLQPCVKQRLRGRPTPSQAPCGAVQAQDEAGRRRPVCAPENVP